MHGYRGANTCLFALFLVIASPCLCGACIPPTPTRLLLALCWLCSFFCCAVQPAFSCREARTEQDFTSWSMPPRSSSCACSFQHYSCEYCSFVWPPSPPFIFYALSSNINSTFSIFRRAGRHLFTVTNVAIHGCSYGRVGNERVHIGFLIEWDRPCHSSMHRLGRRCAFLIPSESTTLNSLTPSSIALMDYIRMKSG